MRVFIPHQPAPPAGFFSHPASQAVTGTARLQVVAIATSPVEYLWRLNGVPFSDPHGLNGQGTPVLFTSISGVYDVVVSNACGAVVSEPAEVTVTAAPRADWNGDAVVNSQDFFTFLNDFFTGDADFNSNGVTDTQDFFAFLNCFLRPC